MAFSQEVMRENVQNIREKMARAAREAGRKPEEILLCAASKVQSTETVALAQGLEIDLFGENRVQELCQKFDAGAYGSKPVHMIGHLQTNKVRQTVGRAAMIQSVDSLHLLQAIDAEARRQGLRQDILIEINIGGEESKSGIAPQQICSMLENAAQCSGVAVRGLMAIPPVAEKKGQNRHYFALLRQLFVDISTKTYDNISMDFLSMGMSADYEDAILEGANIVRIGTAIFGRRY